MGEGKVKKIAAISLISVFLMSGCAVHNDETSIGKFGLAYKSNIQRKLDNQYYTEAEASLARGRISGAENIVKNDATHFCVRITWRRSSDIQMWRVRIDSRLPCTYLFYL